MLQSLKQILQFEEQGTDAFLLTSRIVFIKTCLFHASESDRAYEKCVCMLSVIKIINNMTRINGNVEYI